jgi:hypothetical protein
MFENRKVQLENLDYAYKSFVETVRELSMEKFVASLGNWTPRDILAHFIGWNRITLAGCAEICEGKVPFYFYDGTNDYRKVNAGFIERFNSQDREELLKQMEFSKNALVSYLGMLDENEWEKDTGLVHYRGGSATVARCVDSLIRDYRKHREEIALTPDQ